MKMTKEKRLTMFDLPIYRDYFDSFFNLIKELDVLLNSDSNHKLLIKQTYIHAIEIYPLLNSGYNYWDSKIKVQIYNKVRMLLSKLLVETSLLEELNILKNSYYENIDGSIKYMSGLIKKFEI